MQNELRLENVPDLEFLSSYERSKIASSLVEVKFEVRRRGWFLTLVNGRIESKTEAFTWKHLVLTMF